MVHKFTVTPVETPEKKEIDVENAPASLFPQYGGACCGKFFLTFIRSK